MSRRFVANISIYVYSDEEDFDAAQKDAFKQADRMCSIINTETALMGEVEPNASIEKFYSVPFGTISENIDLNISGLKDWLEEEKEKPES